MPIDPDTTSSVPVRLVDAYELLKKPSVVPEYISQKPETTHKNVAIDALHEIRELENKPNNELLHTISDALYAIDKNYLIMACAVYLLYKREYHRELGYPTFGAFVQDKLDFSLPKAYGLKNIYEKLITLSLPAERVRQIGWAKMTLVARVMTDANAQEWLRICEEKNTIEVKEIVRRYKNRAQKGVKGVLLSEKSATDIKSFMVFLKEKQYNVLHEALSRIQHMYNVESDADALEIIALEYLGLNTKVNLTNFLSSFGFEKILDAIQPLCPQNILLEITYLDQGSGPHDDMEA
jgi:hypothetical protein